MDKSSEYESFLGELSTELVNLPLESVNEVGIFSYVNKPFDSDQMEHVMINTEHSYQAEKKLNWWPLASIQANLNYRYSALDRFGEQGFNHGLVTRLTFVLE